MELLRNKASTDLNSSKIISQELARSKSSSIVEQMLSPLIEEVFYEQQLRCISFSMFVEFMFANRFSRGVEDDELLGLIFAMLLHRKRDR